MLSFEEMPEDNADLASVKVEFPHLAENREESCPVPMEQIVEYLTLEGEAVRREALRFVRTAKVADSDYWVWEFSDSDGNRCYVTVSKNERGQTCTGYDVDWHGLTAEQYMLGDYHNVF